MTLTILLIGCSVLAVAGVLYLMFANKSAPIESNIVIEAKERSKQRAFERSFFDTEPVENPYDRSYDLSDALTSVEVDESANGYGMLDDEQKRVIAAIFDNQAVVPTTMNAEKNGIVAGSRWSHSVFGELNRVEPINEKDIWASSRN
ncbi:MAG TPA: hypothetical protein VIY47_01610 [Ignavibacteriaceae bacterium]